MSIPRSLSRSPACIQNVRVPDHNEQVVIVENTAGFIVDLLIGRKNCWLPIVQMTALQAPLDARRFLHSKLATVEAKTDWRTNRGGTSPHHRERVALCVQWIVGMSRSCCGYAVVSYQEKDMLLMSTCCRGADYSCVTWY